MILVVLLEWFLVFLHWNLTAYGQTQIDTRNARTEQSGSYSDRVARNAIDGNTLTCCTACTTCDPKYKEYRTLAWWQVDLVNSYTISRVNVTSPNFNPDNTYLQNFTIWVSDDNVTDGSEDELCIYYNTGSYLHQAQQTTINCTQPITGRYLTIARKGGIRSDAITICEIKIFGILFTTTTFPTTTSRNNSQEGSCADVVSSRDRSYDFDGILTIVILGVLLGISVLAHIIILVAYNIRIRQLMSRIKHINNFPQNSVLTDEPIIYEPMIEYATYNTIRTYGLRSTRRPNAFNAFNARRRSQPRFPDYYSRETFNFERADPPPIPEPDKKYFRHLN